VCDRNVQDDSLARGPKEVYLQIFNVFVNQLMVDELTTGYYQQDIFEREMLRKIYGPVQEGDTWRIRYNEELNRLIKGKDIVKFIKARRIRWLGHVKRMEVGAMPRRTMEGRLFIGRR
jgi:hypothetical protein